MGMEGETSSKPSNPSEDTSTSWRVERSGGGGIVPGMKRKVGEQAGRVAKVARCMEGTQGSTGGPLPEI